MPPRRYSDDDRATALAALQANGGDLARTARQLDIPFTTLRQWRDGSRHPEAAQMSEAKKSDLAERFEQIAGRLIGGVSEEKIAAAGCRELVTSAAIAVDKCQLLRGEPTNINAQHLTLEQANRADDELERWRGGRLEEGEVSGG